MDLSQYRIVHRSSQIFLKTVLVSFTVGILAGCNKTVELPAGDPGNGGLLLPSKFEALVVSAGVGRARHIVVNDNGDIYVKLRFNDVVPGAGGTVGLRDFNKDGKASI